MILLLQWHKGLYDCKVIGLGSGMATTVEVVCSVKSKQSSLQKQKEYSRVQYLSFDSYWNLFTKDPKWFLVCPMYIHPPLQKKIQVSINRILLGDLTTNEISCLDRWKTYLCFRISPENSTQ